MSYASLLRNQILPTFGRRQLSRIRPIDVQEWIARMQNRGLSASRVRQATHLLGSIMKAAIAEGMIAGNPWNRSPVAQNATTGDGLLHRRPSGADRLGNEAAIRGARPCIRGTAGYVSGRRLRFVATTAISSERAYALTKVRSPT